MGYQWICDRCGVEKTLPKATEQASKLQLFDVHQVKGLQNIAYELCETCARKAAHAIDRFMKG